MSFTTKIYSQKRLNIWLIFDWEKCVFFYIKLVWIIQIINGKDRIIEHLRTKIMWMSRWLVLQRKGVRHLTSSRHRAAPTQTSFHIFVICNPKVTKEWIHSLPALNISLKLLPAFLKILQDFQLDLKIKSWNDNLI